MPPSRYDPFTYILKDFAKTFTDHSLRVPHINLRAYFLFWFVPFLVAIAGTIFLSLSDSLVNVLLISLSVFAALLFNILLLIYDVSHKAKESAQDQKDPKVMKALINETFTGVSFSILVSIIAIVLLIAASFGMAYGPLQVGLRFFVFYLVILFIMSLFIDLKRIYVLLQYEISA